MRRPELVTEATSVVSAGGPTDWMLHFTYDQSTACSGLNREAVTRGGIAGALQAGPANRYWLSERKVDKKAREEKQNKQAKRQRRHWNKQKRNNNNRRRPPPNNNNNNNKQTRENKNKKHHHQQTKQTKSIFI